MNRRPMDIQTKIVLLLIAVILPIFLIVTVVQNKLTKPLLESELRQLGVSVAESVGSEAIARQLLWRQGGEAELERDILEKLYLQPSILRLDVFAKDVEGKIRLRASSLEETNGAEITMPWPDRVTSFLDGEGKKEGQPQWDILVPIRQEGPRKGMQRVVGVVHVLVSTRSVARVLATFSKVTATGAGVTTVVLILLLNYFLRKTVANEKRLQLAENTNLQLSEQLHEAQRKIMNIEKLAVMGQLTAGLAHEIGTPLNAVGGHVQLLSEELEESGQKEKVARRISIISGELNRIEQIVKGFLQTTSKPDSQRQLVDLNQVVEKTLSIVQPRVDGLTLNVERKLDRGMGPIRVVPMDVEQILLNLANNALDSLKSKVVRNPLARCRLSISTKRSRANGQEWAEIRFHDTGTGIRKSDLGNVGKPFFTTKGPGEGTGLGLSISRKLAAKYGGVLEIESKEGSWAQVILKIPYQANA